MKRLSLIITLSVIFVTLISTPLLATDPDNPTLDIPTGWEDETTDSVEQPFWERLLIGNSEDSIPTNIIMAAVSSNEFAPPMSLKMLVSSPSPEASEMIRHQEEEIDHATGTGRLTIPLYTLTSGDLTVPLTLQHRLGGFKADEKGGWIGLGWHLSGGGCVTRRIIGMPDELVPFDITTSTKLGNSSNTDSDIEYLMNLQELKKDASYDRYSYICPGSSGEFIIKDGTIVPLLNNGDVIEFTGNVIDKIRDFTVTTPDGTKYFFTEREHVGQQPILSTLRKLTAPAYAKAVSTWHLTKIQSPGGGEVITYSYSTLSSWNRKTVARSETHTVSVYTEKTLYSGSQLDAYLPSGTITTFLDQKVLSKISSRMGDVTFTNETKKSTVDDTPSRLSKIIVSSKDGVNVREIRLNGEGQLSSCNIYADNVLIDGHTFSYNSGYSQGSTDFFGYCNGKPSNRHIVINSSTGKISDDLKYDLYYCKARSMQTHTTAMGLTTTYDYEPATVSCVRKNGQTTENIDFQIGIRIKSLTYEDAATGRKKIRKFTYSKGISNVNFASIGAWAFISVSGERNPSIIGTPTSVRTVTFLDSSKIPGFRLEDAQPYYGYVEEQWEGTGISTPIKTTYTFDTSHCMIEAASMSGGSFGVINGINDRPLACPNALFTTQTPQAVRTAIHTGSLTAISLIEKIGFGPLRTGVTHMTYESGKYKTLSKDTCFYTRIDSTRTMTGFYQEYAVCQEMVTGGVARRTYTSVNDFRYGNLYVCSGTFLLDSAASRTYFSDGNSGLSTTRYLYSSKLPPMVVDKNTSLGGSNGGKLVPDPSPFYKDSITRKISFPVLTGTRERTGGHVREHYTAISENVTSTFFKKVVANGQRTLPVLDMYVIDNDTIIQSYQYGLFNNTYRPTALTLTTNNGVVMDWQRIDGYTSYGHPTGIRSMKNPNETYTWGGGGDLLTKITITGGSLSQSTSFTHTPLVGCTSITPPDGSKVSYTYKAGRLASATNPSGVVVTKYEYGLKSVDGSNRISTLSRVNDAGTGTGTFSEQAVYYDGFGEGCISLLKGYGGSGQDVGIVTRFDALGRPLTIWNPLPITSITDALSSDTQLTNASKSLYSNDSKAYVDYTYPISAESYAKQTRIQGTDFSSHPATAKIVCSRTDIAALKVIKYFLYKDRTLGSSGYYANGELTCLQETDGNGNSTYTFTDALGNNVLVRKQSENGTFSDTYTVFNNWGQPLVILPPEASARLTQADEGWSLDHNIIANYAFTLKYDAMHRLRYERTPGCREKLYAYDSKSRLAYSQDGVHGDNGECTFYLYDQLSRIAMVGICRNTVARDIWDHTKSLSAPHSEVILKSKVGTELLKTGYQFSGTAPFTTSTARLLTASYYDNYSFLPADWVSQASGTLSNVATSSATFLTGNLEAVLPSSDNKTLLSVNTYAKGGILLRQEREEIGSGHRILTYTPSVAGLPLTATEQFSTLNATTTNTYDRFGRLQSASLQSSQSTSNINLVTNSYNSIGQISKESAQGGYQRTVSIDIRGKLNNWSAAGLTQTLLYGSSGKKADWAGRVTAKTISYPGHNHRYDYTYNSLGFLTDASFSSSLCTSENFTTNYTYDRQANIKSIQRQGKLVDGSYGKILDLNFERYGNKLIKAQINTFKPNAFENQGGISYGSRTLTYDVNGNVTADGLRDIGNILYNDIDKPSHIYFSNGDRVFYTYSASGRKLAEEYFSADKTISRVRQLIGSFELVNGSLDRIQIGSGYITKQGTYNIFIPDYQGNVVGVYDTSQRRLIQTTDYYPYGQPLVTSTSAEVNRHKFGGKEYSTEFGLGEADFVARRYAPLWGGFTGPDPKAIDYPQFSPWAYCAGDPINYVDITGKEVLPVEGVCMAAHVYGDMTDAILIGGWQQTPNNLGLKLSTSFGLKSAIYVRKDANGKAIEYAYVTAGTEMELADVAADALQVFGLSPQHYFSAKNAKGINTHIQQLNPDNEYIEVTFIGHSLGASDAVLNALVTNRPALTFNPAGLSFMTKLTAGIALRSFLTPFRSESKIKNFIMCTDPLNYYQDILPIPNANGKREYRIPTDLPSVYNGHSIENLLKSFGIDPSEYKIKQKRKD